MRRKLSRGAEIRTWTWGLWGLRSWVATITVAFGRDMRKTDQLICCVLYPSLGVSGSTLQMSGSPRGDGGSDGLGTCGSARSGCVRVDLENQVPAQRQAASVSVYRRGSKGPGIARSSSASSVGDCGVCGFVKRTFQLAAPWCVRTLRRVLGGRRRGSRSRRLGARTFRPSRLEARLAS